HASGGTGGRAPGEPVSGDHPNSGADPHLHSENRGRAGGPRRLWRVDAAHAGGVHHEGVQLHARSHRLKAPGGAAEPGPAAVRPRRLPAAVRVAGRGGLWEVSWAIPAPWAAQLEVCILLLARALGLCAVAPIFRGAGVPPLVRMGLAGVTAALLVGPAGDRVASAVGPLFEAGPWAFGVLAGEFAVGAALGFVVALFVSAVQVAGQLMDLPLGFGMVHVLDPQTGTYAPVLGQFQSVLAMLVFFGVNAHHAVLRALAASYGSIPPGGPVASIPLPAVVAAFGDAFALGVRLAIPLVAAAF